MRTATHFAFLLTLLSMHCKAQTYIVNRIGIEHGLSSNFVVSITQDKQGFLWFATEFGLNRFDGNTFRVYKKSGLFGQAFIMKGLIFTIKKQKRLQIIIKRSYRNW